MTLALCDVRGRGGKVRRERSIMGMGTIRSSVPCPVTTGNSSPFEVPQN